MLKRSLLALAALVACAGAARLADARSLAGYGGKAWVGTKANCFSDNHGSTNQNCSGGHYWFLPLDIDLPAGDTNALVTVWRPNTSVNVGCQSFAVSTDLLTVTTQQAMTYSSLSNTIETLRPGRVSVAGGTYHAFVWCYMDPGTRVINVNW